VAARLLLELSTQKKEKKKTKLVLGVGSCRASQVNARESMWELDWPVLFGAAEGSGGLAVSFKLKGKFWKDWEEQASVKSKTFHLKGGQWQGD